MSSSSTYDLEGVPLSIDLVLESSYVREEARLITEAPLAIMSPPSYAISDGVASRPWHVPWHPLVVPRRRRRCQHDQPPAPLASSGRHPKLADQASALL